MLSRFAFLIAMFIGLVLAPVRSMGTCEISAGEPSCYQCCADPKAACCEVSDTSQSPVAPAKSGSVASDAKQLLAPTLVLIGLAPQAAVEPPFVHRQHAARIPALLVLDLTCIRLI